MGYGYAMILVGILGQEDRWGIWETACPLLQIYDRVMTEDLTTGKAGLKYREIPAKTAFPLVSLGIFRIYDLKAARSFSKP